MKVDAYGVAIQGVAGSWGAMHMAAYQSHPKVRIVAVCDINADGARARVKAAGIQCKIYADFEKMLEDDDVEVISIVTPSSYHARDAVLAIQAGKHVLVEKPIATTLNDLAMLKQILSKATVKTMAGFVLRWNGMVMTLKALMKEKAIGEVFMAQADYWQNVGWLDVPMNAWLGKKAIAGSSLLAGGCHPFDTIRYLMGGVEATEVFAYGVNFGYPEWDHVPTTMALMKLSNGAVCKLVSTLEPCAPYLLRVELLGTQGTILNNRVYVRRWLTRDEYLELPCDVPGLSVLSGPMWLEIDHFIECIDQDVESHANLADAIKTHEALMAADLSVAERQPILLPLI